MKKVLYFVVCIVSCAISEYVVRCLIEQTSAITSLILYACIFGVIWLVGMLYNKISMRKFTRSLTEGEEKICRCKNCGEKLAEGSPFCRQCGTKVEM